ncbi:MAG: hypothetical protein GW875_05930 [Deltaproteobacteria bacterium]|nr:hypothetical protein [Deltaproteobacteria bacterium]NCP02674.1 hypothetical protein [Deltaproteobacteria bacterium]
MKQKKYSLTLILFCLLLPALASPAAAEILAASVVSVEKTGKYTILELQQEENHIWAAASGFEAKTGDEIEFMGGVLMSDFYAKGLDRTFPEILFLTNIRHKVSVRETAEKQEVAAKKLADGATETMPDDDLHRNLVPESAGVPAATVEEIKPSAGMVSIADLYAKSAELAEKTVTVRGKVIKVSNNILGKTWLTLSDGTGTAPDNILRVTTQENTELGVIVSATGFLRTNINLGAGYSYKVLLENAVIAK